MKARSSRQSGRKQQVSLTREAGIVIDLCAQAGRRDRREVTVACRDFCVGKEDWNRGIRALTRAYSETVEMVYLSNGMLQLSGIPGGDTVLDPSELTVALADGLAIRSPGFEADIAAADLRRQLRPIS